MRVALSSILPRKSLIDKKMQTQKSHLIDFIIVIYLLINIII
jgi:hypothetical protein